MLLIIERANGERLELEVRPGVELPQVGPGDRVSLEVSDGQVISLAVDGNDLSVLVADAAAGAPAESYSFEDLALYLIEGDSELSLDGAAAVDGEPIVIGDAESLFAALSPAAGPAPSVEIASQADISTVSSSNFANLGDLRDSGGADDGGLRPGALGGEDAGAVARGGLNLVSDSFASGETLLGDPSGQGALDQETLVDLGRRDGDLGGDAGGGAGVTLSGRAVDGYISDATVFRDANGNGVLDEGEVSTTTDLNGNFSLTGGSGPLVMFGGVDISTGLPFSGTMRAPADATVISPLTTLVQNLVEAGVEVGDAQTQVAQALDIPESFQMLTTDPVAATVAGAEGAAEAMRAGVLIANTAAQVQSALEGGSSGDAATASTSAFTAIAETIANNGAATDLTDGTQVEALLEDAATIEEAASGDTVTFDNNDVVNATNVITASNQVAQQVDTTAGADEVLTELAQVGQVAQGEAADAIEAAVENDDDAAVEDFDDEDDVQTRSDAAEVGDVDGADELDDGDNVFIGTDAAESIEGLGGNDVIRGGGGNDAISGGAGDDQLFGEAGNDVLRGGTGNDLLDGGTGIDAVRVPGSSTRFQLGQGDGPTLSLSDTESTDVDVETNVEFIDFTDTRFVIAGAGSSFESLSDALAVADSDDTIVLADDASILVTSLTIDEALTIRTAAGDSIVSTDAAGVLVIDFDSLPANDITELDLSGFNGDVRIDGLGSLSRLVTSEGQEITLDGQSIDSLSEAGSTLTIAGDGAVDIVNANLSLPNDGVTEPSVLNLLALEFEGRADQQSLVPENFTVNGSHTDAIAAFWIQLDALFEGASDSLEINTKFVFLGNDYVAFLRAGGEPLLDLVQLGEPDDPRQQTLHDNLLGNLGDGVIANRFGDDPANDPRNEQSQAFGDRPFFDGRVDDNGLYEDPEGVSAVVGFDLANGIVYPDDLPGPYAVLDIANTLNGTAGNDFFFGGGGDDVIDGGAGEDIAAYRGGRMDYDLSAQADGGVTVTDAESANGDEGSDDLTNVERLAFADGTVSFEATLQRAVGEDDPDRPDEVDNFHPGNGNSNENFVIHDNTELEIEVGLKAKARFEGELELEGATYQADTGVSVSSGGVAGATWNFDFSVVSYGDADLSSYDTRFTIEFVDASGERQVLTFGGPIVPGQGYQDTSGGTEGIQGSLNPDFGFIDPDNLFDPNLPGSYDVSLEVVDRESGETVAQSDIRVEVVPNVVVAAGDSLQAAIDAAEPGDTILVAAGTFDEDLVIDKSITLIGANFGLSGTDGARGPETEIEGTITITGDDVVVDGFLFDINASGVGGGQSVVDLQGDNGAVRNSVFEQATDTGVTPFAIGVSGEGASISDNLVDRSGAAEAGSLGNPAISAVGVDAISITDNTLDQGIVGIVTGDGTSETLGITVTGNDITAAAPNSDSIFVTGPDYGPLPDAFGAPLSDRIVISDNSFATDKGLQLRGTNLADDFTGFETAGDDLFQGYAGDDTASGGAGDDTYVWTVGGGNDTFDGGSGTDTFQVEGGAATEGYTVTAGTGTVGVAVDEDNDGAADATSTLSNVENIEIDTGDGADSVTIAGDFAGTGLATSTISVNGGNGGITVDASGVTSAHSVDVAGGTGEDSFTGGAGDDRFDGGAGFDTMVFSGSFDVANLSVTDGGFVYDNSGSGGGTDSLTNVEALSFDGDGGARVLLVGNGGFASIQAAIDAANAGDTIFVAPGVSYSEDIVIDKPITLLGAQAGVEATGRSGTETVLLGTITINGAADGTTIDGFRIEQTADTGNVSVVVGAGATDVTIQNSVFQGDGAFVNTRGILTADNGGNSGLTVSQNSFSGLRTGVFVEEGAPDATVSDNSFDGNFVGLAVIGPDGATVSGNSFTNNESGAMDFGPGGEAPPVVTLLGNEIGAGNGNDGEVGIFVNGLTVTADAASDGTVLALRGAEVTDLTLLGEGDVAVVGNDQANRLEGNAGDNSLSGGVGDDVLVGGGGDDAIDGGEGDDIAVFSGSFDVANLSVTDGGFVYDNSGSGGGTDSLTNVEALSFDGDGGARVLLVGNGGFASIQAAIDAANAGDTIFVAPGVSYSEDIVIDKPITLLGAQAGVEATGRSGTETVLLGTITINGAADGTTIDGFRIEQTADTGNVSVVVGAGATDVTIQNSVFQGDGAFVNTRGILTADNGGNSGLTVSQNSFSGLRTGVFVEEGAPSATVSDNSFDGNLVGLAVIGPDGATVSGNSFTNNTQEGLGIGPGNGISSIAVEENSFADNEAHIGVYADIEVDASTNVFDGVDLGDGTPSAAELAAIEAKINHGLDGGAFDGLVILQPGTIFVASGGSIQAAIDAAREGDTILVADGTYGPIVIDKPLTLLSVDGSEGVTIQGAGVGQGSAVRIAAGVEGVTLGAEGQGFTIAAGAGDLAALYVVEGNSNITVEGNSLSGGNGHALLTGGGQDGLTVRGNSLSGDGPAAVAYNNGEASLGEARPSGNVDFVDNSFSGGENAGLLLGIEAGSGAVTGNSFEGTADFAMLELWSGGLTVTGNAFDAEGASTAVLDSAGAYDEADLIDANSFANGSFLLPGVDAIFTIDNGANTLNGTAGNDVFFGGGGDDVIDGGAGEDVAIYRGSRMDFELTAQTDGSVTLADGNAANGDDGRDDLTSVERLVFADGTLSFEAQLQRAVQESDGGGTDRFHPGDGNPDTGFVIHDNTELEIEAALKAKARGNQTEDWNVGSEGATYYAEAGISSGTAGIWNFDYSVVSYGAEDLSNYDIQITVDFIDLDGTRTENVMVFDPVAHRDATGEDYYQDPSNQTEGLQNSQNLGWQPGVDFDPNASGSYELSLTVVDRSSGETVAQSDIRVEVADIIVAADGSGNFTTIQEAIDNADPGATILVREGTYDEDLVIGTQVTLLGMQRGVDAGGAARSGAESVILGTVRLLDAADGSTIDGFSLQEGGSVSGSLAGIYLDPNATGITIQNNILSRSDNTDLTDGSRGILTTSGGDNDDLTISQNSFTGWSTGVFLNPGAGTAEISDNVFSGNNVGVSVDGPDGVQLTGNDFTDNAFEAVGLGPVVPAGSAEASLQVTLSGNEIGAGNGNDGDIGVYVNGLTVTADAASDGTVLRLQGDSVTDLTLLGEGDVTVVGNGQANRLEGNEGVNTLFGDAGNDQLFGGAGDDRLFGGAGDDELTGGAGNDTFVLLKDDSGTDTIRDFAVGDTIDLTDLVDGDAQTELLFGDDGNGNATVALESAPNDVRVVVEGTSFANLSVDSDGNISLGSTTS